MGKYFGTDVFRGEANANLTADHAYKVGRFLGWYYGELRRRKGEEGPARIVIGKDTRRSSYMFETTFLQYKKNDAEQLEIMEKIRDKLGDHLEVEDRKIFVEEPEIQYTGQAHNIIQFVFKVEFLEDCRQAAIEQMMQEVNMKEMITKGNMQH